MRAVLIKDGKGPAENLYIGEVPDPVLKDNQVLVKVKAFGLNRADVFQRDGNYPPPPGSPDILGLEFSGVVASLGSQVRNWKVGDEVFGLVGGGAYAEYVAVFDSHIMRKPAKLSWEEAASIPEAFLTAFQAMVLYGEIKSGESAMVHAAASGVGIAAIQLARIRGARTVIATASTKEKLDWLLGISNGATNTVNYKTEDFAAEVQKLTNGRGVDVIVDFVGQTHWTKNIESLALDGRLTLLATLSGPIVPSFNIAPILYRRLRIQGSTLRSRSVEYQADLIARFNAEFVDKITGESGSGPIKTYIHKVYSWKDIQNAHRELEANVNIGKIMVVVD